LLCKKHEILLPGFLDKRIIMRIPAKKTFYYEEDYFTKANYKGHTKSWYKLYHLLKFIVAGIYYKYCIGAHSILDIGCATGMSVWVFRKLLHLDAYGVDISHYAVSHAPLSVRPYVIREDCTRKNASCWNRSYDLVVSYDVFEHFTQKQINEVLKHIFTVTKNAIVGIYVRDELIAQIHRYIGFVHKDHIQEHDALWWREYFKKKGIAVSHVSFSRKGSYLLTAKHAS